MSDEHVTCTVPSRYNGSFILYKIAVINFHSTSTITGMHKTTVIDKGGVNDHYVIVVWIMNHSCTDIIDTTHTVSLKPTVSDANVASSWWEYMHLPVRIMLRILPCLNLLCFPLFSVLYHWILPDHNCQIDLIFKSPNKLQPTHSYSIDITKF